MRVIARPPGQPFGLADLGDWARFAGYYFLLYTFTF